MKNIDFGRTIQTLANVGLLVSVLVLAYEVNQSRDLAKAEFLAGTRGSMQQIESSMLVPDQARVWVTAVEHPDAMSENDIKVMDSFLFLWVDNWFQHWLLERAGLIEPGLTFENITNAAAVHFSNDFARIWWEIERDTWTGVDEFVAMVDEALVLAATTKAGGRARMTRLQQGIDQLDASRK